MQTTLRRAASAVALALALGACASVGTQTVNDFGRYQEARAGETTKPELHALFGQPHTVEYAETGESAWRYFQIRSRSNAATWVPVVGLVAGGRVQNTTEASFAFDRAGVLVRSERRQYSNNVNTWAGLAAEMTPDEATGVAEEMQRLGLPFDSRENDRVASWLDHIEE